MTFGNGSSFRVDVRKIDGRTQVVPVGELDLSTVEYLEKQLETAVASGRASLVLDLTQLTFLDSTGLCLIVRWDGRASKRGIGFSIVQGGPEIRRIFEITGMIERLPFADASEPL